MMDDRTLPPVLAGLDINEGLIAFLRQELRRYRFSQIENGKKLPVAVLAGEILAIDDRLDFSPETLRRFLNDEPQKTEDATLRAIAHFLVGEDWLTIDELEGAGRKVDYRAAMALSEFLGIRRNKPNTEFCRGLVGRYRQYGFDIDRFIVREWHLQYEEDAGYLRIAEIVTHYEVDPLDPVLNRLMKNGIAINDVMGLNRMTLNNKPRIGARKTASGIGAADEKNLLFFMADARLGRSRISNILSVAFDDDDNVIGLGGTQYRGWTAISAPAQIDFTEPQSMSSMRSGIPTLSLFKVVEEKS